MDSRIEKMIIKRTSSLPPPAGKMMPKNLAAGNKISLRNLLLSLSMDFTNNLVSNEQLPTIGNVVFEPLEKTYLKVSRIVFMISGLIVLLIGFAVFLFIKETRVPIVIYSCAGAFVVLTLVGWLSNNISFEHSGYALRERDILFKRGWFIRKTRAVPLKRIQHVSVQSGPIERKFGLASISIYTAGSEEADFTIKGITEPRAQQIKEWISTQLNGELK
jgi:membrane protein YdbS with pleckstrin-like domain